MKKYIYYSTIFATCTESFLYHFVIDIKLFYLIISVNFILLALLNQIQLSKKITIIYLMLIITGFASILLKTNTISNFLSQFVGITFVSLYFFNYFQFFKHDLLKIFNDYVYLCFILVLLGVPIYFYNLLSGKFDGFHSIMNEPAHYSTFVLPAFFYSLKNKNFPRYIYKTILFSILLSGSSLAILGLSFSIFISPQTIKLSRILISTLILVVFLLTLFLYYGNFNQRVTDTANGFQSKDLAGANLSSYAFLSNFFVTQKSLENNYFFGSGLGSHEITHQKYLPDISGVEEFQDYSKLNSKDANSLLLRILSDLGIFGFILTFYFIFSNYYKGKDIILIFLSRSILIYFFCKLIREGHYFSPEMYFFVFVYMFLQKRYYNNFYELNKIFG